MSLNLTDIINIYTTHICIDPGFRGRIPLYIGIKPANLSCERAPTTRKYLYIYMSSRLCASKRDSSSLALSWLTMHCYVSSVWINFGPIDQPAVMVRAHLFTALHYGWMARSVACPFGAVESTICQYSESHKLSQYSAYTIYLY